LEGTGKLGRHVKLYPATALDFSALEALIREAYLNMKACLRGEDTVSGPGALQ
jgi:hypothetical protein